MKLTTTLATACVLFGSALASAQDVRKADNYVQVMELKSDLKEANDKFVFENDTLKVVYYFWGDRGILQIGITNKLDVPIFINWSKSFYKNNFDKLSYNPADETNPQQQKVYQDYKYSGSRALSTSDYDQAYFAANPKAFESQKTDDITEIKAKSYYMRMKYHLVRGDFYRFEQGAKSTSEKRNDEEAGNANVYEALFEQSNSPFTFTSMLTTSTSKGFETERYITGNFYVTRISEMDAKHFRGVKTGKDSQGYPAYKFPLKKSTNFYVEIEKEKSLDGRKAKKK